MLYSCVTFASERDFISTLVYEIFLIKNEKKCFHAYKW